MTTPTYLTDKQLVDRFGVHKSTIWRWAQNPKSSFPAPVRLGPGATRWVLADVQKFERELTVGARTAA